MALVAPHGLLHHANLVRTERLPLLEVERLPELTKRLWRERRRLPNMSEPSLAAESKAEVIIAEPRRIACIAVLLALFTVNQWSRSLIFYVVDFSDKSQLDANALAEASRLFMNVDLGFDQAQYGLLASLGFAAFFSLTSLIAGSAVDRFDSRWLLMGAGTIWSLAMEWQAAATRFDDVLGARLLQGFSQAFCNPAAYVALGKITPAPSRATVFGIYSSGVYLGGALAALSILIDASLGWRGMSEVTCIIGLVVAALTGTVLPALPPVAADVPARGSDGTRRRAWSVSRSTDAEVAVGSGNARELSEKEVGTDNLFASISELMKLEAVRWILAGSTFRYV